ncbi:MAG: ATP-binding protein [Actinobacteria bacterium]|nr:MAG: ATP-binding protein [Actinomycetota bacterium]RIK04569.1 MAG: ATP-binding protein [Acidobacteriota bacterium]
MTDTTPSAPASGSGRRVGLIDGATDSTTQRFWVVLDEDAVVQLDDLLVCRQRLPDGRSVAHFGIVVEGRRHIEGATFASDTVRIAGEQTMPGLTARRVEVQVLRTAPELWLAPEPGAEVHRAAGAEREQALFMDQMEAPLAVGLDQAGDPVFVDFAFLNGTKGGHVNISGISGVATKTSYALFLLYQLLETAHGKSLLGMGSAQTRALVFNVKGEDLLHLDRPNARFGERPDATEQWRALGVTEPGPFRSVCLYAPRGEGASADSVAPDVVSRRSDEVTAFGWTPAEFVREGLLRFCFTEADDARTQVPFIEQRVRVQLARHAYPMKGRPGALVMAEPPGGTGFNLDRVITDRRPELEPGEGFGVRSFADLISYVEDKVDPENEDTSWTGGVQAGTVMAFLRRLFALTPRLGHLIRDGVTKVDIRAGASIHVVDVHSLHTTAQRFVVGALLDEVFSAKQGTGREPLRFVVLDELNKYAPREGSSPIKDVLVDIAERGRSLGVLLVGAQQAATAVDPAIIRNSAIKVVGRLDSAESAEYRFLTQELRERATRFLPGTMVLDQPLIPAPIPLRFPFPAFATNPDEGAGAAASGDESAEVFDKL